jgi:hypothetical protein
MPLADIVKIGDANAGVAATASADEAKDVSSKILEFGKILRYLPSGKHNLDIFI